MAKELFLEKYIKILIRESGTSQDDVIKKAKFVAKMSYEEIVNDQETVLIGDDNKDSSRRYFTGQLFHFVGQAKPYVISPALINILQKTSNNIEAKYLWKKSLDKILSIGDTPSYPNSYLYTIDLQVNDLYGFFGATADGMYIVFPDLTGTSINSVKYRLLSFPKEQMNETIERMCQNSKRKDLDVFLKSIFYILCSGQPDLREVKEETRINSPKKIRKLNITKPIIPVIKVGLGFEKTPMYQTDEWERKGHFRLQPYGPKANPTHHDLIWIPNAIAKRKKPLIKQTLAGMQNNPKVFPENADTYPR